MDNNTSKDTEQTRNTPENDAELSFKDVAAALESGDSRELDRLMAVEKEEEEQDTTESTTDTEQESNTNEGEDTQDGGKPNESSQEAAAQPAASGSKEDDDVKAELHRLKSELGRVSALQREVNKLQSELRAEKARSSVTSNATENPNTSTERQPAKRELPESVRLKIETVRQVDPEIADAMETMYKEMQGNGPVDPDEIRRSVLQEVEAQREEEYNERFIQEQLSILDTQVPWARQAFASPEWAAWKDTLSPGKRALAESSYAEDVLVALNGFSHYMQAMTNNQGTNQNTQGATSGGGDPNASTNVPASGNSQVAEARARKVDASPAVRTPAAKATQEFDHDAAFREEYARITKQIGVAK